MLRIENLRLRARTVNGVYGYATHFGPGLNVLAARNSYGKSTLLQSIIYALGLEGMLSASHSSPIGPAMSTVIDLPDGTREQVVESYVMAEFSNDRGDWMRTLRFVQSLEADARLIRVWIARTREGLDDAVPQDTYVRIRGGATNPLGFHTMFAQFLGWDLPLVPTFSRGDVPLYLELLFPMFYVEQKSGWSGTAPKMPTYLGVKDPIRRAGEFILGLQTLARIRAREELAIEVREVRERWRAEAARIQAMAAASGARITGIDEAPTTPASRRGTRVEALREGEWVSVEAALEMLQSEVQELSSLPELTVDGALSGNNEALIRNQQVLSSLEMRSHMVLRELGLVQSDSKLLESRLDNLSEERRRLADLALIGRHGGVANLPVIGDHECPTCHQALEGGLAEEEVVQSVDAALVRTDAEQRTIGQMIRAAAERASSLDALAAALAAEIGDVRRTIRSLKDDLVAPGSAPSLVNYDRRLRIEERHRELTLLTGFVGSLDESLDDLALRWEDLKSRQVALGPSDDSAHDIELVTGFEQRFQTQLAAYGLRSLPASQVGIDRNTLTPVNDGVELAFDLTLGISASDTIRTKWAYFVALLETALFSGVGSHAGLLMFDEPRQQEADRADLGAFVRHLGSLPPADAQVIYATSERSDELDALLAAVPHTRLEAGGEHLLRPL